MDSAISIKKEHFHPPPNVITPYYVRLYVNDSLLVTVIGANVLMLSSYCATKIFLLVGSNCPLIAFLFVP